MSIRKHSFRHLAAIVLAMPLLMANGPCTKEACNQIDQGSKDVHKIRMALINSDIHSSDSDADVYLKKQCDDVKTEVDHLQGYSDKLKKASKHYKDEPSTKTAIEESGRLMLRLKTKMEAYCAKVDTYAANVKAGKTSPSDLDAALQDLKDDREIIENNTIKGSLRSYGSQLKSSCDLDGGFAELETPKSDLSEARASLDLDAGKTREVRDGVERRAIPSAGAGV
jgi:hypothetical protein